MGYSLGECDVHLVDGIFTGLFGWEVNGRFTGCFKVIVYSIYLLSFQLCFIIYLFYIVNTCFLQKNRMAIPLIKPCMNINYIYDLLSTLYTHGFKLCYSVEEGQATKEFYKEEFFEDFAN